MPHIVFMTYVAPNPVGGGGYHRSYQVHYELQQLVGVDGVKVLSPKEVLKTSSSGMTIARQRRSSSLINVVKNTLRRFKAAQENPFLLFARTEFSLRRFSDPKFLAYYEDYIKSKGRPDLCIVDHAGFSGIVNTNRKFGIPTIACTQNLDSLVANPTPANNRWFLSAMSLNFANEIKFYEDCDARLFISKVEAAVMNGLGIASHFYPYNPVGQIRDTMLAIRSRRLAQSPESGLFLMIGSAFYGPTRDGFTWFIQHAAEYGLPKGMRVIVAGRNADKLVPMQKEIPGLEIHGWVEQSLLEEWLCKVQGVLVPQWKGFGALTRLSEMSCAGVPVIVPEHLTYGIDPLVNIWTADNDWQSWLSAMITIAEGGKTTPNLEDQMASQPSVLERATKSLIPIKSH